jgi:hypothetical protein
MASVIARASAKTAQVKIEKPSIVQAMKKSEPAIDRRKSLRYSPPASLGDGGL